MTARDPEPHPVIALMVRDRWTTPSLYRAMPKSGTYEQSHFFNVLRHRSYPCDDLKVDLAKFFGLPIEQLLSAESLAGTYRGPGSNGYIRRRAS